MRKRRQELNKIEWFRRWRSGEFRQLITELKRNKKPSLHHPVVDGLVDFRAANLRKAHLSGANLSRASL